MTTNTTIEPKLNQIKDKVLSGERLTFEDGVTLFNSDNVNFIGYLADHVRKKKSGNRTYFIQNRHINYTNICKNGCTFCAFSKKEGEEGAYTMDLDAIMKAAGDSNGKITEFHVVGGLNDDLPFSYYIEMLENLKREHHDVHIQGFTAVEIEYLSQLSGLGLEETLRKLKEAGLGSLPGGGAEVFSPRVREETCPKKISGEMWLKVMETAHKLGLKSNATMLYGHIETTEEKVEHMLALRDLQDKTNGFMSFIPLPFHPKNTEMQWIKRTSPIEDLKTLAISRLILDNFPHIKAFWIMLGVKIAQISQFYGVDDIDGTVVEEKITHSAGAETEQCLTKEELINLIVESNHVPVERDTLYNPC